jgi:hypothetical protein
MNAANGKLRPASHSHSAIAPPAVRAKSRPVILPLIFLAATAIVGCGFLGAATLPQGDSASFLGGALTLAGALLICGLFALHSRWHGIGGAAVVALAGGARNVDAVPAIVRATLQQQALPAGDAHRAAIAAICLVLFLLAGSAILRERRARMSPPSDHPGP